MVITLIFIEIKTGLPFRYLMVSTCGGCGVLFDLWVALKSSLVGLAVSVSMPLLALFVKLFTEQASHLAPEEQPQKMKPLHKQLIREHIS